MNYSIRSKTTGSKTHGFVAFFFLEVGMVVQLLAVWQLLVLGSDVPDVPFLSANHCENENIELNKNKIALSFCRKCLCCRPGILAMRNEE